MNECRLETTESTAMIVIRTQSDEEILGNQFLCSAIKQVELEFGISINCGEFT